MWSGPLLTSLSHQAFTAVSGVQSSFHQGKSLSCVTMAQSTPFSCAMFIHSFSGTPTDACSAMRLPMPFALSGPFTGRWQCANMGGRWQWLEWGGSSVRQCSYASVGQGSCLFWEGASSWFHPGTTDRLVGNCCDPGRKNNKTEFIGFPNTCWHWKVVWVHFMMLSGWISFFFK